ncbi:DUF928 domain-containing protein [Planktothrix sp. FACHB-1355]|uniref:DUF928 domain-containing protein n=1 Tax=Aerosakkonema funiforme FACHB-1375 TaxID=2949571 RepID=A0A926ZFW9_9CYAN|nr:MULTISPECIES: DUF928 domain-containing protein [Oscillatoriales]MBD2181583.1 DUF928 domain-containing protein [Aerosakkonema funiforme FACHB-1375]MBD3560407.1 DUF928 domain-containing protein [Planktothrix sp. FACHB-1355]
MVIYLKKATLVTGAISILVGQQIGWSNTSTDRTTNQLSMELSLNAAVLAQVPSQGGTGINYKPPNRSAPSETASGGARNYEQPAILESGDDSVIQLRGPDNTPAAPDAPPVRMQSPPRVCSENLPVLLVPQNHAGETTSGRPTFFWYMPDTQSVDFTIEKVGVDKPVFEEKLQIPKAGIIQTEIPENLPELAVGQDYLWSVSVVCGDTGGMKKVTLQAAIRRVAATQELNRRLKSARSERDRARVYAQQGFWYDALKALSSASEAKPQEQLISDDFYSLLEQVGLNQVVAKQRQNRRR